MRKNYDYFTVDSSGVDRFFGILLITVLPVMVIFEMVEGEWSMAFWVLMTWVYFLSMVFWRAEAKWATKNQVAVYVETLRLPDVSTEALKAEIKRRWNRGLI